MQSHIVDLYITLAVVASAVIAYRIKKIDILGAIGGAALALLLWKGGGPASLISLFLFFVFGSVVSSLGREFKAKHGLEQEKRGKRGFVNVMANGGVAMLLSIIAIAYPDHKSTLILMIMASIACACSDTFSSELGNLYGKRYFNIVTLKADKRGKDGVISLAGLGFGVIGSLLIASIALPVFHESKIVLIIASAGVLGNLVDSILGATLQRNGHMNNHQVNFFATLSSALIALAIVLL